MKHKTKNEKKNTKIKVKRKREKLTTARTPRTHDIKSKYLK